MIHEVWRVRRMSPGLQKDMGDAVEMAGLMRPESIN